MAGKRHLLTRAQRTAARLLVVALALCLGALAETPEALRKSLQALYQGDLRQAAALAEDFVQSHPRSVDGRVQLAQAKLALQDYDGAYEQLQEALRLDSRNIDALYHFSKLCTILSQREYQRLYSLAPEHYRVHQLLAESYAAQQDYAKAEEAYQAALRANPESASVLVALGNLKRTQGELPVQESVGSPGSTRFDEAFNYYQRALRVSPRNFDALYGAGLSKLYSKEIAAATDYLRKAAEADANSAVARLALGRALLEAKQLEPAVEVLESAAELQPDMRQAYFLLARAYRQLGLAEESRQALAKERDLRQAEFKAQQEALFSGGAIAKKP